MLILEEEEEEEENRQNGHIKLISCSKINEIRNRYLEIEYMFMMGEFQRQAVIISVLMKLKNVLCSRTVLTPAAVPSEKLAQGSYVQKAFQFCRTI